MWAAASTILALGHLKPHIGSFTLQDRLESVFSV